MRVLTVSPTVPWPPDHGTRLRGWHLLRRLAATDDVVALTWVGPDDDAAALDAVRDAGVEVIAGTLRPFGTSVPTRVARRARAVVGGSPPWIQAMAVERAVSEAPYRALLADVHRRHAATPFDVVVLEAEGVAALPLALDLPVVVHRHNVFTPVVASAQRGLGKVAWALERRAWRRFDRTGAGAAAVVATTSESAEVLRPLVAPTPVTVVPNGVDLPAVPVPVGHRVAAFVGAMDYAPNRGGAQWAAAAIWPLVRRACPDAELRLVGKGGGPELDAAAGHGVRVLGYVPQLRDALEGCAIGVVPLRTGMGIKNKTLELLAYGLPVVTTRIGAEGIDPATPGLVIADEPVAFAAAVVDLLADPAACHRVGLQARQAVGTSHSWDRAAASHREVLATVVEGRSIRT